MTAIDEVKEFVKKDMDGICGSHDFFHIERVRKLTKILGERENCENMLVAECGALLHEYFDEKFFESNSLIERESVLHEYLKSLTLDSVDIQKIIFISKNIGYGKSLERGESFPYTLEFQIAEDSDRLEAVGAIAIARAFAYGGKKNKSIYDPKKPHRESITREDYNDGSGSSLDHFYEKLLKLKDLMHTESGKNIAIQRHNFMEEFLEEFHKERNCEV